MSYFFIAFLFFNFSLFHYDHSFLWLFLYRVNYIIKIIKIIQTLQSNTLFTFTNPSVFFGFSLMGYSFPLPFPVVLSTIISTFEYAEYRKDALIYLVNYEGGNFRLSDQVNDQLNSKPDL